MKSKLSFTNPEQAFLEHRQFSRIELSMPAFIEQNNQHQGVEIIDISINGVAIHHRPHIFDKNAPVTLHIHLGPKALVSMELHWVHSAAHGQVHDAIDCSGFCCDYIDDMSMQHLSHLVANSLNNERKIQQELHLLKATH